MVTLRAMAHAIQALIVQEADARALCRAFPGAKRTRAQAERWLVPLTSSFGDAARDVRRIDLEQATPNDVERGFHAAITALGQIHLVGPVVIAVTEYFGGVGSQASAVIEHGRIASGPFIGRNAINQALRITGVEAGASFDEFEAVGLQHWRMTDYIEEAGE